MFIAINAYIKKKIVSINLWISYKATEKQSQVQTFRRKESIKIKE